MAEHADVLSIHDLVRQIVGDDGRECPHCETDNGWVLGPVDADTGRLTCVCKACGCRYVSNINFMGPDFPV